jgi:transmembrane sensor
MGMIVEPDDGVCEVARRWAIRLRDPAFADWDGFTGWLEANPAHNGAYEAALDEMEGADAFFDAPPHTASQPVWTAADGTAPRRPPRWRMPAMAAGVAALAVGGGWLALERGVPQTYATAAGERRTIELADGSRVLLNGNTRVTLDPGNPRQVAMASGEALFEIRHDAASPFVVTMSDSTRLVDAGTTFNVVEDRGTLDVAVAEGAVIYQGKGADLRLAPGEMLSRDGSDATPVKGRIETGSVGAWRTGYLQFADAPLDDVARTLSRNLGVPVFVDPAVAGRRFSGSVMLDGGAEAVIARVGPLLGVPIARAGKGWRMMPPDGARP